MAWVIKLKGTKRVNIKPGMQVLIVLKKDQRSGKLTEGIVKDVLTNSPNHHHGIKVRLKSGKVGRVKKIVSSKQWRYNEWPIKNSYKTCWSK